MSGYAPFGRAVYHTGTEKGVPMLLSTIILNHMHILINDKTKKFS